MLRALQGERAPDWLRHRSGYPSVVDARQIVAEKPLGAIRIRDADDDRPRFPGPGYRVRQVVGQARRLRSASRPRWP